MGLPGWQIQNLQSRLAGWSPRKKTIFLFKFAAEFLAWERSVLLCSVLQLTDSPTHVIKGNLLCSKAMIYGTSLVVQWLRLCSATARDISSIPGEEIKIPHAVQLS